MNNNYIPADPNKVITVTGRIVDDTPNIEPQAIPDPHRRSPNGDVWFKHPITGRMTFDPVLMAEVEARRKKAEAEDPRLAQIAADYPAYANADYSQIELRVARQYTQNPTSYEAVFGKKPSEYLQDPANEPLNPSDESTAEPELTDDPMQVIHLKITETPLPLRRAPTWLRQAVRESINSVMRDIIYETPVDPDLQRSTEKGE